MAPRSNEPSYFSSSWVINFANEFEQIDEAISKAEYEYGFGCDYDANQNNNSAMNKILDESEYRYECDKLNTGGHL